jgi:hypothetical protein
MYRISSREQPTRVVPPASGLGEDLILLHCKKKFVMKCYTEPRKIPRQVLVNTIMDLRVP